VDQPPEERPADEAADGTVEEPLEAFYGEDDPLAFGPAAPRLPSPPPKKARTAAGALMTGIALGLRNVFDPEKKNDTIAIEQEAPGEPEGPQRYEIRLNGSPRDAQAVYRPWVDPDGDGP
jgi:hypothetical protein